MRQRVDHVIELGIGADPRVEEELSDHIAEAAHQWERDAHMCGRARELEFVHEARELLAHDVLDRVLPEAEIAQRVQREPALLLPLRAVHELEA